MASRMKLALSLTFLSFILFSFFSFISFLLFLLFLFFLSFLYFFYFLLPFLSSLSCICSYRPSWDGHGHRRTSTSSDLTLSQWRSQTGTTSLILWSTRRPAHCWLIRGCRTCLQVNALPETLGWTALHCYCSVLCRTWSTLCLSLVTLFVPFPGSAFGRP